METKHTPGPWIIERDSVVASNTPDDGGDIICEAPERFENSMRRWQANARLIAAAPELLAEVKELLRNAKFQDGHGIILTQDAEALEAIIAKVEGR